MLCTRQIAHARSQSNFNTKQCNIGSHFSPSRPSKFRVCFSKTSVIFCGYLAKMINLLFMLILAEVVLILTLLFRTPLRKLVIMGLDQMKQGKGPVMAQTLAGTMFVLFISTLNGIMKFQRHLMDGGPVNPTEQVLMANNLLEASLMGFSLFLAIMIDRLHYYIKELQLLRTIVESVKEQNQEKEDRKSRRAKETKASERNEDKLLKSESNTLPRDAKAPPEAKTAALKMNDQDRRTRSKESD